MMKNQELKNGVQFLFFSAFTFLFFLFSGKVFAAIDPDKYQGDPLKDRQHFLWQIIGNLQSPDDPNCQSVAEAALLAAGVPADQVSIAKQDVCAGFASMKSEMQTGMNSGSETIETNLFSAENWHWVEGLYFQHKTNGVVDGKIEFSKAIDFMSYDFMLFMDNFAQKMDARSGYISLDADMVGGLAGYGAILTMYNVPAISDPIILVNDEEDKEGVVSGLSYDRSNRTIIFNAAHFTSFRAVDKSDLKKDPKIKNVEYRKYWRDGVWKLRVTVLGDNFNSKTKVYFGKTKAESVNKINSHKLIATFLWSDLEKQGKRSLAIKVKKGSGEKVTFDDKKSLEKIKIKK